MSRHNHSTVPGGVIWWDENGNQMYSVRRPRGPLEPVKACLGFGVMALISCISLLVMRPDDEMMFPVGIVLGVLSFVMVITGSIFYQKRKKRVIPLVLPRGQLCPLHRTSERTATWRSGELHGWVSEFGFGISFFATFSAILGLSRD